MELREVHQQNVQKLTLFKMIEKIKCLEEELIESQVQLEKFSNDKLVQMLKGQKCSSDKTSLGFDK